MAKIRKITKAARLAWSASGKAHSANLTRSQLNPEITAEVDRFVDALIASVGGSPTAEQSALIQSAKVSYRVVALAATRPVTAYQKSRGRGLMLTAHQSNLRGVLKELRVMRKAESADPARRFQVNRDTILEIVASESNG